MSAAADRFRRLMELVGDALEQAPADRDAWLVAGCGEDTELLEEARALLADADHTSSGLTERLDDGIARAAARVSLLPGANDRIGPYTITGELGRGGMGVVYAARQEKPLQRDVALKVIAVGMHAPHLVARFESEQRVLAGLDHPNIAHIFDAGATPEGLPYFAMERVHDARTITAWCDAHALDIPSRLRVFRQVLAAVQHAHQRAVVHRDLKPSNVLVTESAGQPVVKVIDFGIAKVVAGDDVAGHTVHRGPMGTLEYMSPEQAYGAAHVVDTRSDIYSLGVLLYELLTGTLPIPGEELRDATPLEVQRLLGTTEPPSPSRRVATTEPDADHARARATDRTRLIRTLRGDLDNIVGVALRREPADRYASVAQLADDIDRYLTGHPVSAHPSTWWYRTRRFAGRHRGEVSAAVAALLVVVLSTVAFTVRLAAERDRARAEEAKAAEVAAFLQQIFQVSDPVAANAGDVTARQLLDDGANRIATALTDQPEVQSSLLGVIGSTYHGLGLLDDAEQRLAESIALLRQLGDEVQLGRILHTLGVARLDAGRVPAGMEVLNEALALRLRLFGAEDSATASTRSALALALRASGDHEGAIAAAREAVAVHRRTLPPDHPQLALSLTNLGFALRTAARFSEAEDAYREALEIRKRILDPSHPHLLTTMGNLAVLFEQLGRLTEAEQLLEEVLARRRERLGELHYATLISRNNLAYLFWRSGQYARASEAFRDVAALAPGVLTGDNQTRAIMLNNVGVAQRRAGDFDGAESAHREALAMNRRLFGVSHPRVAADLDNLGRLRLAQGRATEAEELHREALAMRTALLGADNVDNAESLSGLAEALIARGNAAEAESLLRRALALRTARADNHNARAARSHHELGVLLGKVRRWEEAAVHLDTALAIRRELLDAGHPDIAVTLGEQAALLMEQGRLEESDSLLVEGHRIVRERLGDTDPETRRIDELIRQLSARKRQRAPAP